MDCFLQDHLNPECFEKILQTVAEGVIVIDSYGIIRYSNRSMEILTGLSRDELNGKPCESLFTEHGCPIQSSDLLSKEVLEGRECFLTHTTGRTVPVIRNGRLLKGADGAVIGAVETFADISILQSAQNRLKHLEEQFRTDRSGRLIGKSAAMQEIFNLISLAAASNATILVNGETGTGKELVALSIHEKSGRAEAPFVKINCSAIPESLLESELFGHVRGSFTGAIRDKIGRFESADTGTLFLDEVGELSPLIQVKILRFLQEKEFERVGESVTRKADVRIIAATHRDLRRMVREGRFREDLYYRLKVFPIFIPPLRERKEDIGPLIDHFIARFNAQTGKSIKGLNHDAAVTLMDYCWPGNIRELENAIEHAFVTCRDELIDLFDLPLEIRRVELRKDVCRSVPETQHAPAGVSGPVRRHRVSGEEIRRAFQESNGNMSEAARILGVDRTTVWRWMRKKG
ncbi:MAG: sigma 54-interacting transcriptional regulator [Chitinispirillaceae bacterium]|nr:sigma 54-interacting transcriptional regulator [Chitinispirillaceae bacterium]